MEEKITDYICKKYNPKAIVLIGSQVSGEAKDQSDWDLMVFTEDTHEGGYETFEEQTLDVDFIKLPVADDYVIKGVAIDPRMKVLFDTDHLAKGIVERSKEAYEKGPGAWSAEAREKRKKKLYRMIQKMLARPDSEGNIFFYTGIFYELGLLAWFASRGEWSLPLYKALPYIKEKDPETFASIEVIHGKADASVKIEASQKFYERLFGE